MSAGATACGPPAREPGAPGSVGRPDTARAPAVGAGGAATAPSAVEAQLPAVEGLTLASDFTAFLKDPRTGPSIADFLWVPAHDRLREHGYTVWNWNTGGDAYAGWVALSRDDEAMLALCSLLGVEVRPGSDPF